MNTATELSIRDGLQISARSTASLLAQIWGPSFYNAQPFGKGQSLSDLVSGPRPEPWLAVALNPQPLPPGERYALALADAHVQELLTLDRMGTLLGGEVRERTLDQALGLVAASDGLCPDWPKWTKGWPKVWPTPPPPPWLREEMTPTELFVFGARLLAASELMEQESLRNALADLGEKAIRLSMPV